MGKRNDEKISFFFSDYFKNEIKWKALHGTSGIQLGWLASQSDMLSKDWIIID